MFGGHRPVAVGTQIQPGERDFIAAIGHVVHQPAIALCGIDGFQQGKRRLVCHHTLFVARRLVQIDDAGIAGMRRVQRAVNDAAQALVGADIAEHHSAEDRRQPLSDLDPQDAAGIRRHGSRPHASSLPLDAAFPHLGQPRTPNTIAHSAAKPP